MAFLANHRVFSTRELDAGVEFASRIWQRSRADLTGGKYGLRWNNLRLESTDISYVEQDCSVDLRVQGPLSDHFGLVLHQSGEVEHRVAGRSFVSDKSDLAVHAPGIDLRLDLRPFKVLLIMLDGEAVRFEMARRFSKLPPYENWVGALPKAATTDTLRSAATWLAAELDRPGSVLAIAGKSRVHAERMLRSIFVESLAQSAPVEADAAPDIGMAQVRRAEEWIDDHLTEAIGVEEIANAIGVGVRSLQIAFRRVRGCSPLTALSRRRLERARRALLSADPGATVTSIATEYGFFELGRFSSRYRAQFGEKPTQTLLRRSL